MQLAVETVELVEEIEPAMFEVILTLIGGTTASLRMNAMTMRFLSVIGPSLNGENAVGNGLVIGVVSLMSGFEMGRGR